MVKKIILLVILSRILIYVTSFALNFNSQQNFINNFFAFARQWDSPHYLYLAGNGYQSKGDEANFIVFMPIYPLLIGILSFFIHNAELASLIISNAAFLLASVIFYKTLRLDYSEEFSAFVILLISFFPTSYFFSSTYPESVYFLFFSLSVYAIRHKEALSSLYSAGLATLSRPFGIAMWPMLFIEMLESEREVSGRSIARILKKSALIILSAGMFYGIYLIINYLVLGKFFAFQSILRDNWGKTMDFPWNGVYASWQIALNGPLIDNYKIFTGWAEALPSTIAWIFVPLSLIKKMKIRPMYTAYFFSGVLLFTSTGFILSAPRYILSLPPFFIILAKLLKNEALQLIWVIISVILLVFLSAYFAAGQWAF